MAKLKIIRAHSPLRLEDTTYFLREDKEEAEHMFERLLCQECSLEFFIKEKELPKFCPWCGK